MLDPFLPNSIYLDMSNPFIFDQYKDKKIIRTSRLVKCPYLAVKQNNEDLKITYDDKARTNFILGTGVHYREEVMKTDSKLLVASEKTIYVYFESLDLIFRGTPDQWWLDFLGPYVLDFKSCKPGAFYYKLKNPMPWNHITQLSLYAYLIYVSTGIPIETGVIKFVNKFNPRQSYSKPAGLNSLATTERFIMEHPLANPKADIIEATNEYLKNGMSFVCNLCSIKDSCPIKSNDKKPAKKSLKKTKSNLTKNDLEGLNSLLN